MRGPARFALATAMVALTFTLAACGRGSADKAEEKPPPPPVPARYKALEAVYALSGNTFYILSFEDGVQKLLCVAEGDVNAATFAAWVPERSQLVYEAIQETGRELWVFDRKTGEHERVAQKLQSVIAVRGGREVLFLAGDGGGDGLRARDLETGEERVVLDGTVAAIDGADDSAPTCFTRSAEGGQELYVLPDEGDPVRVAEVPSGRQVVGAVVLEDAIVGDVLRSGSGEYGDVTRWERSDGKATVLAEEARLLDVAADGGALVQKNLRGGVSGVTRSLVAYVPSGKAADTREPMDLGAYVGSLHVAAFTDLGDAALVAQRLEGSNRLALWDLDAGESTSLAEDPDLQFNRMLPLEGEWMAAVRMRPGLASSDDEGSAPSLSSVEDELVLVPADGSDTEPVRLVSTASGPLRVLGVFARE